MDETISALIYSWGPILFFAVVIIVIVRMALIRQGKYFKSTSDYMKAQSDLIGTNVETMRKISASLERIAAALEKRG